MAEKNWRFGFQLYGQALPCQGCQDRQLVLDSLSRGSNPVSRHLLHLLMYVLYVPTVDARTSIEEKLPAAVSMHLVLYVRTYPYLVLVYLLIRRTHLMHIPLGKNKVVTLTRVQSIPSAP